MLPYKHFMKKIIIITLLIISLLGCANHLQSKNLAIASTTQVIQAAPAENKPAWSMYAPDPDHLWNRVFRQLYRRTTLDGKEYGSDELDPLLWFDTTYLLNGTSHQQAIQVLDEFL